MSRFETEPPCCQKCMFFDVLPVAARGPGDTDDAGYCVRNPPAYVRPMHPDDASFPKVVESDWCGEFRLGTRLQSPTGERWWM